MELAVGAIIEGKVSGITKFGAFVTLPGGGSGLVHISEIANAYVNDVHDYLSDGQSVTVRVLNITDTGKVNLSIKQALPPEPRRVQNAYPRAQSAPPRQSAPAKARFAPGEAGVRGPSGDTSFEDKLKHFMQDSDNRINGSKLYAERKGAARRRK